MNYLNGRTNRATYWASLAVIAALLVVVAFVDPHDAKVSEGVLMLICIPRLHDIGRSGWWVLGAFALELAAIVGMFINLPSQVALAGAGGVTLVIGGLLIWLGGIPGDPNANRFGNPPARGVGFSPNRARRGSAQP